MKIIRTVLGDILNTDIGITNAHDHLIRSGGPEVFRDPSFLMDNVTMAVKEFERWINAGGRTIICMDPIGCGRNVDKMLQVSNAYKDRGNIIMVTGFHKAINYCPNTSFLATAPVEQLAELTIKEITEGMDRYSYNGPIVDRVNSKAGLIKAGTSYRLITNLEEKALHVAAITQKETGCAISMHTDYGTMALESLNILKKYGANLEKVVLCHMQRNPDIYYYEKIVDRGATICFDEPNKPQYRPDIEIAESIKWLINKGYGKQIVLGMDGGKKEALASYMEPIGIANGCEYLLTRFIPLLKRIGINEQQLNDLLISNPAEVFSINVVG